MVADFEQQKVLKKCFESLEPIEIIQSISIIKKQPIIPGKTLLFLDEIQDCPEAISALRYFYEQLPELHVIAAGSLLEFAIEKEDSSIDIKIIVESSKNSLYSNDHFFYIHAYPYDRVEENEFINLDTNDGELNNNQIVYSANYKGDIFDFEIVRFGMVSRVEKQRYFTRSLKNRYIKN